MHRALMVSFLAALATSSAAAQTSPTITTFAGTGVPGTNGDGDLATLADIYPYGGLAVDGWGNVFFSDIGFDDGEIRIRRVDAVTNIVTTVAGGGAIAYPNDGIAATQASISFAYAIAIDDDGNLFIGDDEAIRRVDAVTGLLSTHAGGNPPTVFQPYIHPLTGTNLNPQGNPTNINGVTGEWLSSGDGGLATDAVISRFVGSMTFAPDGDLVFMDLWQVRRIDSDTGIITSVAGSPTPRIQLHFHPGFPNPYQVDISGFYSGDGGLAVNSGIGYSFTLASNAAGDLFFGDGDEIRSHIRRIEAATGIIAPYAGSGTAGFSGDGGPALEAEIRPSEGLAIDSAGNVYFGSLGFNEGAMIRRVDAATGIISTVVGNPFSWGYGGDGGPATDALLDSIGHIAFDPAGNLYIVDYGNYRIRMVTGLDPDAPPTADAGPDQSIHAGTDVIVDGSASFDDNTPTPDLSYSWTIVSAPGGSAATLADPAAVTTSFIADSPGTYVIELVVEDELSQASPADQVVVSSTNLAPTANAGSDQVAIIADAVLLDGTASSDPEMDPLAFFWNMAQAPVGSAATLASDTEALTAFTPDIPGSYVVELVVDDGFGPSAPDSIMITAITGEEYVEIVAMEALNEVIAAPPTSVTTGGNQQALGSFLQQVIQFVQASNLAAARTKLQQAIERMDGCALRGEPDAAGPGRDWITDCSAQAQLYDELVAALDAISP